MAIPRTSLLDLPLPVTGSLSGDWGAATNNGLTEYLDIAVAGSLVLNTDADVTLTSTDGDENGTNIGSTTAQYAILRWTATGSTTRNITVPAKSKTYIVINATGGTQSIVLRGAGPTTGVTIVSGEKAVCAWNGSDFVKVGGAAGGTNTQVQYNNAGVFGGITNATTDGTTLSMTSPKVITGINDTNGAELLKVTATASAVNELTISNAATGSAPTLSATGNDTNIGITLTPKGTGTLFTAGNVSFDGGTFVFNESGADKDFRIEGDTDANLFFTDASTDRVGIGTTSAGDKLEVNGGSGTVGIRLRTSSLTSGTSIGYLNGSSDPTLYFLNRENGPMLFFTNNTERARITSGGYFKASSNGTYIGPTGAYAEFYQSANNYGLIVYSPSSSYTSEAIYAQANTAAGTGWSLYTGRNDSALCYVVYGNGNVVNTNNSYGQISDIKTKQDIVDAASQWDDIKNIRVRKFRFKNDPTGFLQIGVVAQELETVSPGLVEESPDYEEVEVTDEEGNVTKERQLTGTSTKSVKYSVLYMKAIKALQEAMTRIEQLEAKVSALEGTQP